MAAFIQVTTKYRGQATRRGIEVDSISSVSEPTVGKTGCVIRFKGTTTYIVAEEGYDSIMSALTLAGARVLLPEPQNDL